MGKVLEIAGWLIILVTIGALVYLVGLPGGHTAVFVWLIYALPALFSGIVIIVFGSMLSELQMIRANAEEQTRLLRTIADRQA